jgi:hypothetical protein
MRFLLGWWSLRQTQGQFNGYALSCVLSLVSHECVEREVEVAMIGLVIATEDDVRISADVGIAFPIGIEHHRDHTALSFERPVIIEPSCTINENGAEPIG